MTMDDQMQIDISNYWKVKAQGIEWIYVIQRLIKTTPGDDPTGVYLTEGHENGELVYLLKKERYPAKELARVTGIAQAVIEQKGAVRLSLTPRADLPQPTVDYWGEA